MDLIIAPRAHGEPQERREGLSDLSCKISSRVYFFRHFKSSQINVQHSLYEQVGSGIKMAGVKWRKYWSFLPYCASMNCLVKRPMVR